MANYYTHFSFQFPTTPEEYDNFLEVISIDFEDPEPPTLPRFLSDRFADVNQLKQVLFDDAYPDFGISYEQPTTETLGIYDYGGCPDLEAIAKLVQLCCPSNLPLGFEWSNTCDKQRPDGFGGGWIAIFPDRIESENTATGLAVALNQ
jgi:hypothetical protein